MTNMELQKLDEAHAKIDEVFKALGASSMSGVPQISELQERVRGALNAVNRIRNGQRI